MKIRICIALLAGAATFVSAPAAEFSGYVNLTTDYVFRGVSYSDGNPAAQLGADVLFDPGVFAGAYASTIDISNGPDRQRDLEIIYYLGYGKPVGDDWTISATAIFYTYPGATGSIDYDYEEISLALNYRDWLWLDYAYSPDLYQSGYDSHNVEAYAEWTLSWKLTAATGVGWYDTSSLTGAAYTYWQAGLSRPAGPVELDLRYHDTSRWVPIVSTESRAEPRIVLSVRFQF